MKAISSEERDTRDPTPHLSYSRLNRYLTCPEQYRCYYILLLRPRVPSASLVFGQIVHRALAHLFQGQGDPAAFFVQHWSELREAPLRYAYRESWEKLLEKGRGLLELFVRDELPRLGRILASEKAFELTVTSLKLPLVGILDLLAEIDGQRTVVDFKTAGQAYEEHEVALSDQLTTYQLAEPEARRSALCVLVKTKEPRIDWYFARRSGAQLAEFLIKLEWVAQDIAARRFYKRPGPQCAWCDYLPLCMGDKQNAQKSLVKIE